MANNRLKLEGEFLEVLEAYLDARVQYEFAANRLELVRSKMDADSFILSDRFLEKSATLFAEVYGCKWHWTNQGNISFADSLSDIANTRRDDALNAFRKQVVNWRKTLR